MRIPKFIKKIVAFCTPDSSRYNLGAVKCELSGGVASVIATDGRALSCVTYADDGPDVDVLLDAKAAKVLAGEPLSGGECGSFPDYKQVLGPPDDGYSPFMVDPAYLRMIADLHEATKTHDKAVVLWFPSTLQKPMYASSNRGGYMIRSVVMPLACDDGSLPKWPDRPTTGSVEPDEVEPPKMKAAIGTKRTRKAKAAEKVVPSVDAFAGAV